MVLIPTWLCLQKDMKISEAWLVEESCKGNLYVEFYRLGQHDLHGPNQTHSLTFMSC